MSYHFIDVVDSVANLPDPNALTRPGPFLCDPPGDPFIVRRCTNNQSIPLPPSATFPVLFSQQIPIIPSCAHDEPVTYQQVFQFLNLTAHMLFPSHSVALRIRRLQGPHRARLLTRVSFSNQHTSSSTARRGTWEEKFLAGPRARARVSKDF
jgi:hypothetical protein